MTLKEILNKNRYTEEFKVNLKTIENYAKLFKEDQDFHIDYWNQKIKQLETVIQNLKHITRMKED